MPRWIKPVSVLCVLLLAASGCETLKQNKAATGAGAGALAGGLAGALIGGGRKRTRNVLIGAALGAAAGYGIGKYLEHREKTAQQTNQAHNYQPAQGTRLEIVGAQAEPGTVQRGGSVDLKTTYAIMAPNPQEQVQVTETRTILYSGEKLTEFGPRNVTQTPGTYTTSAPMSVPQNATPGNYELVVTVSAAGQSKQEKTQFTVQ